MSWAMARTASDTVVLCRPGATAWMKAQPARRSSLKPKRDEAELLAPDGRQVAAIVWARNATVIGAENPSLSRVGDAHQLAEAFGDMVGDAFAPADRKPRRIAEPDPCARFGPRVRPEGFIVRAVTGLYQPEVSGGRPPAGVPAAPRPPDDDD